MKDIVFTGSAPHPREALKIMAEEVGYRVRSSFCSKTQMVVANTDLALRDGSSKIRKAAAAGLPVMSYEEFYHNLGLTFQA